MLEKIDYFRVTEPCVKDKLDLELGAVQLEGCVIDGYRTRTVEFCRWAEAWWRGRKTLRIIGREIRSPIGVVRGGLLTELRAVSR